MSDTPLKRISPLATRSMHETVLAITSDLMDQKAADAAANARLREIHNLHREDGDSVHRMLNAVQPGTYVRPHRHSAPPKDESFLVLQGAIGLVLFDDDGEPDEPASIRVDPKRGVLGADLRAGVWHTFIALEPDTVVFEVKPGPYLPASDKDFAPWAPAEDGPDATAYLAALESRFRSLWGI